MKSLQGNARLLGRIGLLTLLATTAACSAPQPWVQPYERANLADPVMALDRDPVAASFLNHVQQSREGARGAEGSGGGGCGCN